MEKIHRLGSKILQPSCDTAAAKKPATENDMDALVRPPSEYLLIHDDETPVSRNIFDLYDHFAMPIFNRKPVLYLAWKELSQKKRVSVEYSANNLLTQTECRT